MHLFRAHGAGHPTRRWQKWAVAPAQAAHGSSAGMPDDAVLQAYPGAAHIAYEAYLNEPADYIADSIYNPVQNPLSSAVYLQQW